MKKKTSVANREIARMAKANVKETACGKTKTSKHAESFCFDLQKVLQILFGETGDSYYYSEFAVYNFTF